MEMNNVAIPSASPEALSIGALLLDAGKITASDAERIIQAQKNKGLRFGDAAKQLGLITEDDIQQILSQQFNFPYLAKTDTIFHHDLIAAYQPFHKQVEVLRALRSQLMLRWFTKQQKCLSVVSSERSEGRSFICANLAVVFSQLGERTLLIDADLRQPNQHSLFKLEQKHGLADILAGRQNDSAIIQIPQFRDLSVLPAGTVPPNPVELIGRSMNECIQQWQSRYDVILIDTPAFQQGIEAQMLATISAGALLLARQNKTRLADMEAMKMALLESATHCVGAVINEFK